jgi:hypothetical protein
VCFGRRAEGENPRVYPFRPIEVVSVRRIGGVVLLIAAWFVQNCPSNSSRREGFACCSREFASQNRKPRYLSLSLLIAVKDWAKNPLDHVDPYHLGIRFVGFLTA